MKYGILGDIHSNIQALEAVMAHLQSVGVERLLSVGDIVGYGANPIECIDLLQSMNVVVVSGNHDQAVTGKLNDSFFNPPAKAAVTWTKELLKDDHIAWLEALPMVVVVDNSISVAHATFYRPEAFDYIQSYLDAAESLNVLTTPVGFLGHSHVPAAFLKGETLLYSGASKLNLRGISKALINVGSIGQPRDENPKAACGVYDAEAHTYELHRVTYDIDKAAKAISNAGLPEMLGERLAVGR